jgi:carbonic anhydrase
VLIHHTDCGMLKFSDDDFRSEVQMDTGIRPPWAAEAFSDLDEDLRQSMARIKTSPFIPRKESVRGFVYDVHDGSLREVTAA